MSLRSDHGAYLCFDIGTSSVRCAAVSQAGNVMTRHVVDIQVMRQLRGQEEYLLQSSDEVWQACISTSASCMAELGLRAEGIRAIGFDATCSLVVIGQQGKGVTVDPVSQSDKWDIVLWMDHRAKAEASLISSSNHSVLRYVGGSISPEMQMSKLLWLKTHMSDTYDKAQHFFDLPDFLTWKATGRSTRSLCSVVCKWTYVHEDAQDASGWNGEFLRQIGLGDLVDQGFARIGTSFAKPGEAIGTVSNEVADALGVSKSCIVSAGSIDAHAGCLGTIGAGIATESSSSSLLPEALFSRISIIMGTSTCHMAMSQEQLFTTGVWGPYHSVVVPQTWLAEGGQSAAGALLDHIVSSHPASADLQSEASSAHVSVFELLHRKADILCQEKELAHPFLLARSIHVLPDFHGNRSPFADPNTQGAIVGLSLSQSTEQLVRLYVAAILGLAFGTKDIVDALRNSGYAINEIFACGGLSRNKLYVQAHADVCKCTVTLPKEDDAMAVGVAVLASVASKQFDSIVQAMSALNCAGQVITPTLDVSLESFLEQKQAAYKHLQKTEKECRNIMDS